MGVECEDELEVEVGDEEAGAVEEIGVRGWDVER